RGRARPRRLGRSRLSGLGRPAPAVAGPLEQVLGAAEGVGDAVLAAMADEQHALVVQRRATADAAAQSVAVVVLVENRPRLPVRALDHPRDDVLEPTEHRTAI